MRTITDTRRMDPGIKLLTIVSVALIVGAVFFFAKNGPGSARDLCIDGFDDPGCHNAAILREAEPPKGPEPAGLDSLGVDATNQAIKQTWKTEPKTIMPLSIPQ